MRNLIIHEGNSEPNGPANRRYLVLLRFESLQAWQLVTESRRGVSYDEAKDIVAYNELHNGDSYDLYTIVPIMED